MSETTSKLSLFKYNTTADAKQPFSINDCMNDNWDKLDAFATSVDTIFSSSFSSNLDKKVFSDINKELGNKLEADVLLAENGYIKFNNGLVLQWYKDSTATRIVAETVISKVINLPISINKNVIGIATFSIGSNDNWARSEILFAETTKTTSTMHLYCHNYSAIIAINVLFIGY